jgi:hypothetical protein
MYRGGPRPTLRESVRHSWGLGKGGWGLDSRLRGNDGQNGETGRVEAVVCLVIRRGSFGEACRMFFLRVGGARL